MAVVRCEGCIRKVIQDWVALTRLLIVLARLIVWSLIIRPGIRKCAAVQRLLEVGREFSIVRLAVVTHAAVAGSEARSIGEALRAWTCPVGLSMVVESGSNLLDIWDLETEIWTIALLALEICPGRWIWLVTCALRI